MRRVPRCAVVVLLVSCGGETSTGTAGSGGSSGTYTCRTACEHVASAQCSTNFRCIADSKYFWECPDFFGVGDCVTGCEPSFAVTTGCDAEARDYLRCFSTAPLTCYATGYPNERGSLDEKPCESQTLAWEGCSACNVTGSDNDCTSCVKSTCCAELKAALGDPDRFGYERCLDACTADTACVQACDDQYASLWQKRSDFTNCGNAACTACCLERGIACYEGGPLCCSGSCPPNGVCS